MISSSDSFESFLQHLEKGIQLLNFIGQRAQAAIPKAHLDHAMVADCAETEGHPSYMLSITGIDLSFLEKRIAATNAHLQTGSISISLYNGPKSFVVTGPPKSLYGLILALRKERASSSDDQSKIPFSQRKPVFSMRFLPVNVPFHSEYLSSCTSKVVDEDLAGKELWLPSDLKISVLHTETGMIFGLDFMAILWSKPSFSFCL